MEHVSSVSEETAREIAAIQQQFYADNHSFVICCLQPAAQKTFADQEFFDIMNITPSESEAWDIVQMEEIERELLRDD
mgnify:CR=1 FL=1